MGPDITASILFLPSPFCVFLYRLAYRNLFVSLKLVFSENCSICSIFCVSGARCALVLLLHYLDLFPPFTYINNRFIYLDVPILGSYILTSVMYS